MTLQTQLYTSIQAFYRELARGLRQAQTRISMMYLTFDDGRVAEQIASVLLERAAAGVDVRLMVDEFGLVTDHPRHALRNHALMNRLRRGGVRVTLFQPSGSGLGPLNRLHCKLAAIDEDTLFMGGSNIGDYYLTWSDTNLRLHGPLGRTFHDIFDYVRSFSRGASAEGRAVLDPADIQVAGLRVWLTVPRHRADVRQALLDLIRGASSSIHIRTWYFLPDEEILDALCRQARRGVEVTVLLSHRTRVRPIDSANYVHAHRLALAGGLPYRFTASYMHSKVAWNNRGEVLLGSANMDPHSLHQNFEDFVFLRDPALAAALEAAFVDDLRHAFLQTPEIYASRALPKKALTHAFNLASGWL
jgi:cardiolipin synthase